MSIAESAPFVSDTDCLNATQPTIPKRAKIQRWRREVFGTEIEVAVGGESHNDTSIRKTSLSCFLFLI